MFREPRSWHLRIGSSNMHSKTAFRLAIHRGERCTGVARQRNERDREYTPNGGHSLVTVPGPKGATEGKVKPAATQCSGNHSAD